MQKRKEVIIMGRKIEQRGEDRPILENPRDGLEVGFLELFDQYQKASKQWSSSLPGPDYGPDGDSVVSSSAWVSDDNYHVFAFRKAFSEALDSIQLLLAVPGEPYNLFREQPFPRDQVYGKRNDRDPIRRAIKDRVALLKKK